MKRSFKLALVAGMLLPTIVFGGLVVAQNPDTPVESPGQQSQQNNNSNRPEEIEQRLQERKNRRKPQLTFVLRSRIQSRCAPAQGILKSTESRVKKVRNNRNKVYENMVDVLTKLSANLKDNGVDTTDLDSKIDALKDKVEAFKTQLDTHVQAVSDIANMECATDPEGFWVTLEEARSSQKALIDSAGEIKKQFHETIKPTLQDLKKQLSGTTGEQGE